MCSVRGLSTNGARLGVLLTDSWFLVVAMAWSANNGQLVEILTVLGFEGY
jgi:hypothetical protein